VACGSASGTTPHSSASAKRRAKYFNYNAIRFRIPTAEGAWVLRTHTGPADSFHEREMESPGNVQNKADAREPDIASKFGSGEPTRTVKTSSQN
jgi:hypothetical protein